MHDYLRVADLDASELASLIELSERFKRGREEFATSAAGRVVGILFEKPSLRTRFSLESALARIGAHPIGAYDREVGLGSREPVPDAGRVLDGYVDAIAVRTAAHERAEQLADACAVPVVNALSDAHHPLQALADMLTLAEVFTSSDPVALKGLRLAYVGDGNNVAHSLIEASALLGLELACACPPGHEPDESIVAWAREQGAVLELTTDPQDAVAGAVAVYTDVWTSMGHEGEAGARRAKFEPYRVTADLLARADPDAVFLHCLPAHRGEEVTDEVMDGPASIVFLQAHNRLPTAAALFIRMFAN
jgi:ornithine carbamoyltransferase